MLNFLSKRILQLIPTLFFVSILIAHTKKLEGYKQMPDGLVRVIGLKLK